MHKRIIFTACFFIMLSIILGAMATHMLRAHLKPQQFESFEVAVRYQGFLSLGILVLALNSDRFSFSIQFVLRAMMLGMILFCGSIYALALGLSSSFFGPITPIGGLITIVSWILLLYRLIKN